MCTVRRGAGTLLREFISMFIIRAGNYLSRRERTNTIALWPESAV